MGPGNVSSEIVVRSRFFDCQAVGVRGFDSWWAIATAVFPWLIGNKLKGIFPR
jgi:hypothetical protein